MNSLERVIKSLKGEETDRVSVIPQVFGVTAKLRGYSLYEYVTDPSVVVECQIEARELIGHDVVYAFVDLTVEAEAMGAEVIYRRDAYPVVKATIKEASETDRLRIPEVTRDGRMAVILESSKRLRDLVSDTCPVVACIVGPLTIAGQLLGIEPLLYQIVDAPEAVETLLDMTEEVAGRFGRAVIQAGAHGIILFDPMASPVVVPEDVFVRMELPRLKRLFQTFKDRGALFNWLSITGNCKRILPYYRLTGADLVTVDYQVNLSEAYGLLEGMALTGNIKPYVFISSTYDEIKEKARECLHEMADCRGYLLGTGCEVPVDAPLDGVRALVDASEEFRRDHVR